MGEGPLGDFLIAFELSPPRHACNRPGGAPPGADLATIKIGTTDAAAGQRSRPATPAHALAHYFGLSNPR